LHRKWLENHNLVNADIEDTINPVGEVRRRFYYVTCGDRDLKTCLPQQLEYHGMEVPAPFSSWVNFVTIRSVQPDRWAIVR